MEQPRALAFDLDGTLSESKSPVSSHMGDLLARLCTKVPVAVMSGGSYQQFQKQLLPALPTHARLEDFFLFPVSAGICYRLKNDVWELVYDHSFSPHERDAILHALKDAMEETGFTKPPTPVWGERIEDRGAQISFSALGQEAPVKEKKTWDPYRTTRLPLQEALIRRLPNFSIRVNAATTIDITPQGINKAYGVRKFGEITGVPISEMLYVGDALFPGGNDEIVKETGIKTQQETGPEETMRLIQSLLG